MRQTLFRSLSCTLIICLGYSFFFADRTSKDHFQRKYSISLEQAFTRIDFLIPEYQGHGVEILLDHPQNLDVRGNRIIKDKDTWRRSVEAMFQTERTNSGTNYLTRIRGTRNERLEALITDDLNFINMITRFGTSVGPMQLEDARTVQTLDQLPLTAWEKKNMRQHIHEYETNLMIGALTILLADGETVVEKARDYNSVAYDPIVARMQQLVRDHGGTIKVDGVYGVETRARVLEHAALFFDLNDEPFASRAPATGDEVALFLEIYHIVKELHQKDTIAVHLDSSFCRLFQTYYLNL